MGKYDLDENINGAEFYPIGLIEDANKAINDLDSRVPDLLAYAEIKANSAVVTALEGAGGTDIIGLSIDVLCDGSPIYLAMDGYAGIVGGAAVQYAVGRIMEGTQEIQRQIATSPVAGTHYVPLSKKARITPTAGLHTYKINLFRITATSIMLAGSDTGSNQSGFSLSASRAPLL